MGFPVSDREAPKKQGCVVNFHDKRHQMQGCVIVDFYNKSYMWIAKSKYKAARLNQDTGKTIGTKYYKCTQRL